jgi:hypothetical protein
MFTSSSTTSTVMPAYMRPAHQIVSRLLSEDDEVDINDFMRGHGTQAMRMDHGTWIDGPIEQPKDGDHAVMVHTVMVEGFEGPVPIGSIYKIVASIDTVQAGNYVAVVYPHANIRSMGTKHYNTLGWKYTTPVEAAKAIISAFFKE